MDEYLKMRAIVALEWLVEDAKWRFDDSRGNLDMESFGGGGYSPELTDAIDVLEKLKEEAGLYAVHC